MYLCGEIHSMSLILPTFAPIKKDWPREPGGGSRAIQSHGSLLFIYKTDSFGTENS